jgi:hypothetical protein
MKQKVVVETTAGVCKLLINPPERFIKNLVNAGCTVLENPDLSQVKGLPPEMWKIDGLKVRPLTGEEQDVISPKKSLDVLTANLAGHKNQEKQRRSKARLAVFHSVKWLLLGVAIGTTLGVLWQ